MSLPLFVLSDASEVSVRRVGYCRRRCRYPRRDDANWENDCTHENIFYATGNPRLSASGGTDG
jgi:hypothetical protein